MSKTNPKEARIQAIPMFADADRKALERLVEPADEVTVPAGHVLTQQGQHHHELFIIESGTAEVVVDGKTVADIPAGQMIGELSLFDRGSASATVRAATEMTLMVLPYNRVDQIMDDNPTMVRAVAAELAARLRAMDARAH
jgi:CRP/FNR family transcriptional regulator, cyclic AMP receptor protein